MGCLFSRRTMSFSNFTLEIIKIAISRSESLLNSGQMYPTAIGHLYLDIMLNKYKTETAVFIHLPLNLLLSKMFHSLVNSPTIQ